ncbi:alpha/beta-hydrolase [Hypomontagnella monticulosa]|nr:alpha/beta-hydrolase [Hypomontagnella monticulosa]
MRRSYVVVISCLIAGLEAKACSRDATLLVDTTVGPVEGFVDAAIPDVKQWLGIPFAEPPVGSLRWRAPVPKTKSLALIEAKTPPNSCAQYLEPGHTIFNDAVPEFLAAGPYHEDCLYLNVIAPRKSKGKLPVLVWVHGGVLQYGGVNTPYEKPHKWVQRSQGHIVVMINYRLNIFGFPNAKGLKEKNFGILDQRLALEWVRDNIKQFGGDPEKITLWGQSAGASAVDGHQFAWPSDPIFKSIIVESSVVLIAKSGSDLNQTSFSYVSQQLGCSANATQDEVECMRTVSADDIEKVLLDAATRGTPPLYFSAQADGKIVFTPDEYLARGKAGKYANVPMLAGTNAKEGSSFVPFTMNGSVPAATIQTLTDREILCPMVLTCQYREASDHVTYRYFYEGNFTNISPVPWVGAYHFSEIPLIMGTHSEFRNPSPLFEVGLSHLMQDMWLAFANDPWNGLKHFGWHPYSSNGTAFVLGGNNILARPEHVATLDVACST